MKTLTLSGADYDDMTSSGYEHFDRKREFNSLDRHAHVYAMGRGYGRQSIHRIEVRDADRASFVFIRPQRLIRLWLK